MRLYIFALISSVGICVATYFCFSPVAFSKPDCSSQYVTDSDVKLHEAPDAKSPVIGTLKFHSKVCVLKHDGLWSQVSPPLQAKVGWVPRINVKDWMRTFEEDVIEIFDAEIKQDLKRAIVVAERALNEHVNNEYEIRSDLLRKIRMLYVADGNSKKAAEYATQLSKHLEYKKNEPGGETQRGHLFSIWLNGRFTNGNYRHQDPKLEARRIIVAVREVVNDLRGEKKIDSESDIAKELNELFATAYRYSFSRDEEQADPLYAELRDELQSLDVLLFAMIRGKELNWSVVHYLPNDVLNRPEVVGKFLANCNSQIGASIWPRFSVENIKAHAPAIVSCLAPDKLDEFFVEHRFLFKSPYLYVDGLVSIPKSPEKMSTIVRYLEAEQTNDLNFMSKVMKHDVDIYTYLPEQLQRLKEVREYAARTSDCINLVKVSSKDKDLFLMAALNLTENCVVNMDKSLTTDRRFAENILRKNPFLLAGFSESIENDVFFIDLVLKATKANECPISQFSQKLSIEKKRMIVHRRRACLDLLFAQEYLDPKIYQILVSSEIPFSVLKKLPEQFKRDPKVPLLLPKIITSEEEIQIAWQYSSKVVLLDLVQKKGLAVLTKIVAEKSLVPVDQNVETTEDQEGKTEETEETESPQIEDTVWRPIVHIENWDFWSRLADIAKGRRESCEAWHKLIAEWKIGADHSITESEEGVKTKLADYSNLKKLSDATGCGFKIPDGAYVGEPEVENHPDTESTETD